MLDPRRNYAQRARSNKDFHDPNATEGTDQYGHKITHYSDGSSTVDFGSRAGTIEYDENGQEC
jgi:hypothetical protein